LGLTEDDFFTLKYRYCYLPLQIAPSRSESTLEIGEEIKHKNETLIVPGKPGTGKTTCLNTPTRHFRCHRMPKKVKSNIAGCRFLKSCMCSPKAGHHHLERIAAQFELCGVADAKPLMERIPSNWDCMLQLFSLNESECADSGQPD
jgi:hypothetical protein